MRSSLILIISMLLITSVSAQVDIRSSNNPAVSNSGNIINVRTPPPPPINNNTVNVNNSNCWLGDCGGFRNPFNQVLNTTSQVIFNKATIDIQALGDMLAFTVFTVPIGEITSIRNRFEFHANLGLDFFLSNTALDAYFALRNAGLFEVNSSMGMWVISSNVTAFQTNNTRTSIYTNTSFSGLVNNFTGNVNINGNLTINQIVFGNLINVTNDVCVTGSNCLNSTIISSTLKQLTNNSVLYWSNNTNTWNLTRAKPANGYHLMYCDNGGITWIQDAGGICPI